MLSAELASLLLVLAATRVQAAPLSVAARAAQYYSGNSIVDSFSHESISPDYESSSDSFASSVPNAMSTLR